MTSSNVIFFVTLSTGICGAGGAGTFFFCAKTEEEKIRETRHPKKIFFIEIINKVFDCVPGNLLPGSAANLKRKSKRKI
jgi:hypothetical protein